MKSVARKSFDADLRKAGSRRFPIWLLLHNPRTAGQYEVLATAETTHEANYSRVHHICCFYFLERYCEKSSQGTTELNRRETSTGYRSIMWAIMHPRNERYGA